MLYELPFLMYPVLAKKWMVIRTILYSSNENNYEGTRRSTRPDV